MSDSANVIRLDPDTQRHVRSRIARLPLVAQALHEEVHKVLSEYLIEYFDAIDDAMFEQADKASNNQEQNMYFDSMREVRVQRKGTEGRFLGVVQEAFARLVAGDSRDVLTDTGELSADALSLVQNEDLEQLVTLEDMVDSANRRFAEPLTELGKVLSSLVSVKVTIKTNPFGPSVIALAAMAQFKRLDVDVQAKLLLFKLFDQMVLQRLPGLFQQLFSVLSIHGVNFSTRVSRLESSCDFREDEKRSEVVDHSISVTSSDELVELLSFVQTLPSSTENSQSVDVERVLASVKKRKGGTLSLANKEAETINLVQMLFQFILEDGVLDDQMKALICRLQIPATKLALLDEAFLLRQRHPARLLINDLAQAALQWCGHSTEKEEPKDPIYMLMKRTVDRIVVHFDKNIDIFKETLVDFTAFIEKESRRAAVLEKRTVDAEAGKAKSEEARAIVAEQVALQIQNYPVPDTVTNLIKGPWSNVLFVVGLKYGFSSREWHDQLKVLSDLVWSVQPCLDQTARERLILIIPGLVANLRAGLDSISYNPFELSETFKGLEEIHLLRMRGELLDCEKPLKRESSSASRSSLSEQSMTGFDAEGMIDEIESLMSEDLPERTLEKQKVRLPEKPAAQQMREGVSDDDPHMLTVANFAQGTWFGFSADALKDDEIEEHMDSSTQELLRCRLAAIIKQTGKYIFVNRSGMKVAERTQVQLAASLKDGHLRPLDSNLLFDKALENVVSGLRKSSSSMPGLHDQQGN